MEGTEGGEGRGGQTSDSESNKQSKRPVLGPPPTSDPSPHHSSLPPPPPPPSPLPTLLFCPSPYDVWLWRAPWRAQTGALACVGCSCGSAYQAHMRRSPGPLYP